ncbi:hypothetical protein CABS03_14877 [Colletotrichum abscissum]|uniref:Uncharacterized protein n=1 Tax=Colletotrichum abscissum TaxID=1671311 RepID=A0A9Q0AY81_9PEZI|nr:hypothetical protein CABS02_13664 [Colletotrichum abscissum]
MGSWEPAWPRSSRAGEQLGKEDSVAARQVADTVSRIHPISSWTVERRAAPRRPRETLNKISAAAAWFMLDGGGRICASEPHASRPIARPFVNESHPEADTTERRAYQAASWLLQGPYAHGHGLMGSRLWWFKLRTRVWTPFAGTRARGPRGLVGMGFSDASLTYRISHTCSGLEPRSRARSRLRHVPADACCVHKLCFELCVGSPTRNSAGDNYTPCYVSSVAELGAPGCRAASPLIGSF